MQNQMRLSFGMLALLVFGLLDARGSYADELVPAEAAAPANARTADAPNTLRNQIPADEAHWFINAGVGYGALIYNNYFQFVSNSQTFSNGPGAAFGAELGLYHSFLMPNTMVGITGRGVMDVHLGGNRMGYFVGQSSPYIFQTHVAASGMHFLGPSAASGFYLRADLGYSYISANSGLPGGGIYPGFSGMGLLGGVGYGVELGQSARLLFGGRVTTILFLPDNPLTGFQGDVSLMFVL